MPIAACKTWGNIGNGNQQCCNFYFKRRFKLSFQLSNGTINTKLSDKI